MKPIIVWLLLCAVWGSTWIFIKLGLNELPPFTFALARFILACLILIPFVLWKRVKFSFGRNLWLIIILTGFLQFFVNYGLLFWGEQYISSGLAAVLQATIPAFGLVLAWFYVGESITPAKIVSILLGLIGVSVIFYEQLSLNGNLALMGSLAVVVGAFAASYASVLTKSSLQDIDPVGVIFCQIVVGVVPLTITSLAIDGNPFRFSWSGTAVLCIFYLAITGSVIAFWLYYWLLSQIDVTKAMMISVVTPLVAVVVGSFFGENLGKQTLLGGILILSSVILIVIKPLSFRSRLKS